MQGVLRHPFDGPIYAVSRSQSDIEGLPTYPSVADLPRGIDLALITVPAAVVPELLDDVRFIVIGVMPAEFGFPGRDVEFWTPEPS